jgi:hypothetical protein
VLLKKLVGVHTLTLLQFVPCVTTSSLQEGWFKLFMKSLKSEQVQAEQNEDAAEKIN